MMDKTNVLVEVRDTTKPNLAIPPDIIRIQLSTHAGPTKVSLGKATAQDSCYPEPPLISNDAPEDQIFSPGHTKVTWTADDLRGNSTDKVQNVFVKSLKNNKLMPSLKDIASKLAKALQDSQQALQESRDWSESWTNIEPLLTSIQQLRDLVRDRSEPEGKAELGRQIEKKLTAALAALQQADILIQQSNQADRRKRGAIREQAGNRLTQTLTMMNEIQALSPQTEE